MIDKYYNHKLVSENKYDFWLKEKFFSYHDLSKKPFTIILPPPNITGKLHLGHALDTIISDVIIRYKKTNGFDTLWVPGIDHAGIATQTKIVNFLYEKGVDYHTLGRDKFLENVWQWKKKIY